MATTAGSSIADVVRELGTDVVIDHRTQSVEELLSGYALVADGLGGENLEKFLRALRPGGKAIGLNGVPDPTFARELGLNPALQLAITELRSNIRSQARSSAVP